MRRGEVKIKKLFFQWTIDKFSTCTESTGRPVRSPIFTSNGNDRLKVRMILYPNGCHASTRDYIALKVTATASKETQATYDVELFILNSDGEACYSKMHRRELPFDEKGPSKFISRTKLLNRTDWLPEDTLTVACQLKEVNSRILSLDPDRQAKLKVASDLQQLLEQQNLSDVVIFVNGCRFQAHKAILSARSPVFAAMFRTETREFQTNTVYLDDIEQDVFTELLRFIYTGCANNLNQVGENLLIAADKYGLEDLKFMCERELWNNLTVENAAQILILSDIHSADKLKNKAISFINKNSTEVIVTAGWKDMAESHPKLIVEIYVKLAKKSV